MTAVSQSHGAVEPADDWASLGLAGKAALALTSTFISVGLFSLGAALPPMQASFAGTPGAAQLIQLLGSIAAPAFAVASPFAGRMVERHGVRAVYLGSLALFLVSGVGPMACTTLVPILLLRVLLGIAVAGAFTAGMVAIARLPERQRHPMYGLSAFLGGLIAIFVYQLVGSLAAESWRLAFLVHLLLLPAGALALFLPRHEARGSTQGAGSPSVGGLAGVPPRLLLAAILIGGTMVSSSIYSPFYLTAIGVTDPVRVGSVLAVMAMSSLCGSGLYGMGQRRLGTLGMLLLGMAVAGAGCVVLVVGGSPVLATVGLGLMGAGLGSCGTAIYGLAMETVGAEGNTGAAMGIISLSLYLPQTVFLMAAGALGTAFGPPAVYAVMAVLLAAGIAVIAVRARRR